MQLWFVIFISSDLDGNWRCVRGDFGVKGSVSTIFVCFFL